MHKQILIVGLGKMGQGLALNLFEKGWDVYGYNRTKSVTKSLEKIGIKGIYSFEEISKKLYHTRLVWVMVPAGEATQDTILGKKGLVRYLEKGDIIVDGGNSFYKETKERSQLVQDAGINFLDVGVSGGPKGARYGACMMVGGSRYVYDSIEEVFADACVSDGYGYFGESGAGHFVKMVHNGIEYGMMQAIAEGFDVMKRSEFEVDLKEAARVYGHGSVIESRLVSWLHSGFEEYGINLSPISGSAGSGGAAGMKASEGAWTIEAAKDLGIEVPVIEDAVAARIKSQETPNFQGKIINTLRNQFGGHSVK